MATISPFIKKVQIASYVAVATIVGSGMYYANQQFQEGKRLGKIEHNYRTIVRDSFNLNAKEFDNLNSRVNSLTLTWKQAFDSLNIDKKLKTLKKI